MLKVKLAILHIMFRKEEGIMAVVYATLIVKGLKKLEQVPPIIRPQVEEILEALEVKVNEE